MARIGRINNLKITHKDKRTAILDAGDLGEAVIVSNLLPDDSKVNDQVKVFIYYDAKENLKATTKKVFAEVGDVAYLKAVAVNNVGAFLDWGVFDKDILVPFKQQQLKMQVGESYLVYLYEDVETGRVAASSKLNKYIHHPEQVYRKGQAVDLIISDKTDIGYSAVINSQHWGVLYFSDVLRPIKIGQKFNGFIREVRPDGKINLSLEAIGYAKVESLSTKILKLLEQNDGFIPLSDKSPAELINQQFNVSKKSFKMTIGTLYKKRLITISKDGIRLVGFDEG